MPKSSKILLLAVSAALVLCVFLGVNSTGVRAATTSQDGAYRQINVYSEVLRHIQSDYVEDANISAVTNGALRGLLESLDSDSSYLTAEDYKAYKLGRSGKAQAGINVAKRYGYATVVSVVPGSPADKANLNDGDILEAIGTQDTRDISLAMIQTLLDGAPGSELTVSVVRPRHQTPEKVTMTRTLVSLPSVSETMYENASILYLKPGILDKDHVQQVETKLRAMAKSGNRKVLLDLRDVASGDVAEASRLANFFLKTGTIATLEGQKTAKQTLSADPGKAINTVAPVAILINHGTAGPAEIVAAALLDNKRADLVGEKTFGSGAQLKTFDLADGAALILSVAKYQTPLGKKIEDEGITPGVVVASAADEDLGTDEDGPGAGTPAAGTPVAGTPAPAPVKASVKVDEQLSKAIDLLKGKAA